MVGGRPRGREWAAPRENATSRRAAPAADAASGCADQRPWPWLGRSCGSGATMRDALPASARPRSIASATGDGARDQIDDAVQRHGVHLGEVKAGRTDPRVEPASRWRDVPDLGEVSHVLDVAAQAQARRGESCVRDHASHTAGAPSASTLDLPRAHIVHSLRRSGRKIEDRMPQKGTERRDTWVRDPPSRVRGGQRPMDCVPSPSETRRRSRVEAR